MDYDLRLKGLLFRLKTEIKWEVRNKIRRNHLKFEWTLWTTSIEHDFIFSIIFTVTIGRVYRMRMLNQTLMPWKVFFTEGCSLEIAFWSIKICHFIILINGIYRHNHLCFVGLKIFWLWLTRVQNFKCKITMEELYEYNKFTVDWFKWW